jgi:elongation factor G
VKGPLTNYPIVKCKYVLQDGDTHVVDSSSAAFAIATRNSIRECFENDGGTLLEPVMKLEATCPLSMY